MSCHMNDTMYNELRQITVPQVLKSRKITIHILCTKTLTNIDKTNINFGINNSSIENKSIVKEIKTNKEGLNGYVSCVSNSSMNTKV